VSGDRRSAGAEGAVSRVGIVVVRCLNCAGSVVLHRVPSWLPESRFFGLVQEAHFAASIIAWLVDATYGVFGQFAGFYGAPEAFHIFGSILETSREPRN